MFGACGEPVSLYSGRYCQILDLESNNTAANSPVDPPSESHAPVVIISTTENDCNDDEGEPTPFQY